ncbi:hypothetical protein [Methylocystis hirsuta]|nr:hypothetical protein [Methylocystis hirsuta]
MNMSKFGQEITALNKKIAPERDKLIKEHQAYALSRKDFRLLGLAKKLQTMAETVEAIETEAAEKEI